MLYKPGVAPVQAFAQPDKHRKDEHHPLFVIGDFDNIKVFLSRLLLAVEPGDICHDIDLFLVEPEQIGIFYDIICVGMVVGK